jgi:DNA mismatch endonuclease (patch repair protein)
MGKEAGGFDVLALVARTDHVSPETRSQIMRAVKSKGARSTERKLRAALVASGVRGWRMHADQLPGKPDFIFPEKMLVVFVDGCFWHGCSKCYRRPNSSQTYWDAKVAGNMTRDKKRRAELKKQGWKVLRFWEHEVKKSASGAAIKIKKAAS